MGQQRRQSNTTLDKTNHIGYTPAQIGSRLGRPRPRSFGGKTPTRPVRAAGSRWGGTPKVLGQALTAPAQDHGSHRLRPGASKDRHAREPLPRSRAMIDTNGCAGPLLPIRPLAPRRNTTPSPQRQCRRRTGRAINPTARTPHRRACKSNKAEDLFPQPVRPERSRGDRSCRAKSRHSAPHAAPAIEQVSRRDAEEKGDAEMPRFFSRITMSRAAARRCATRDLFALSALLRVSARNPFFIPHPRPPKQKRRPVSRTPLSDPALKDQAL